MVTGSTSFAIVRFLLGVAEAGFFPGIILYFTYWFPSQSSRPDRVGLSGRSAGRGRARLADIDRAARPRRPVRLARLAGDVHRRSRSDRGDRRHHLFRAHGPAASRRNSSPRRSATGWSPPSPPSAAPPRRCARYTLWEALYNPKVLLLALNYLGIVTASLGMLIFIPQMIKSLGNYSNMTVGWLTMIPYICGGIAMVVWGRISDRMNERRWNLFIGCVFSTVGLVIAGMTMGTLVGAGGNVDRRDGLLRLQGPVLRHAADVSQRRRHWRPALPGSTRSAISAASSGPGMSAS